MSEVSQALRTGIVAAQGGNFERARPLLEQATAEAPGDPIGWFWLAIASPSADAAMPCLRRVLEIDASHEQARGALAKLLLAEASRIAAAGDRTGARAVVAEATRLTPDAQAVWLALCAVTDEPSERLNAIRQAVAIAPDDPQLRTRLRQALLVRGMMFSTDRAEALACFREAATLNPSDPRIWQAIAKLADVPSEAVDAVRQLLRIAPDHPNGKVALRNALVADARALMESELVDAACERWREALTLGSGDVETWLGLAGTTPDQKEAARAVETAYKLGPTDERAITALERLRSSTIDPAKVAPPVDAFARFDPPADTLVSLESSDDPFAELDSSFDAFAQLAVPSPTPEPVVASIDSVALVAPPEPTATPVDDEEMDLLSEFDASDDVPVAVASEAAPTLPPAVAEPYVPPAAPVTTPSNGSSRRTVMIVDDSPTIRKILGLTLERAGYKVIAEPDGESALERLAQLVPDLILLDIAMPKLDGYEVCKRIKHDSRTAAVPVVMLSGKGAYFDKVKGHMAGATEYLTKPFETPAVLAVVTSCCEQSAEAVRG